MPERTSTGAYEPGDLVSVHVEGEWLDGEYLGFLPDAGHVVQIDRRLEVISDQIRRRGGLLA
jgi:hypothetical protein